MTKETLYHKPDCDPEECLADPDSERLADCESVRPWRWDRLYGWVCT